ncbi:sodium/proton antiporter (NhaA family) [Geothermobacter ehrlichii]|uniref:Na(+)/H(+) antiporter NhaA n=1 Tax=Geothermobacter ehrlichii TaxID=213224 RepID=A0A5D3WL59_9BACT|nr:Na+/H+ antiporter NhaA [Geothermobacter ehrlichii]TYO98840.1 sodium/proton antiporter (NhaA family) [Geothermobacter ehrlichii]
MTVQTIRDFLKLESFSGLLLIGAMLLALLCANTPLAGLYGVFLQTHVEVQIGALELAKPLLLWINDGLMAIFFLLVGLEVKREILEGELSSLPQIALPGIAAVGGMLAPALIYIWINRANPDTLQGWAIPSATDIAFALGVLALLGKNIPGSLKLFLMTLAILDDLGAIIVIALFYTSNLSALSLLLASLAIVALIVMNRLGVTRIAAYIVVGALLWICVLKSGVHATLAGVVLAFTIPLRAKDLHGHSPLRHLEHNLHPWVAFGILPLFAFANAGVSLAGMTPAALLAPLPMGIAAGLFVGKQLGIVGFSWIAVKLRLAQLPKGVNWREFHGMAVLCGIGFTMSLFIASLAFEGSSPETGEAARLGILVGSLASSFGGYFLLRQATAGRDKTPQTGAI